VSGLAIVAQDDFAAGILRGVAPDVQPGVGLYSSVNGFYDDDGDIYKRGGTSYYSIPPVAQINNLTFIWSGFLARRPTVVLGDTNSMYYLDGAKKPVNMGGGPVPGPCQGAVTADTLFMPNGVAYGGGGLLQNYYNAGTATFDPASAIVVGQGTAWLANVDVGMFLSDPNLPAGKKLTGYYRVVAVTDNTHLTIDRKPTTLNNVVQAATDYQIAASTLWTRPSSLPATGTLHLAAIADRLIVACGNRVAFSEAGKPWSYLPDDYHDLPQGVQVMGLGAIRDNLMVFTNYGLWKVTNLSYDLTDALGNVQQILSLDAPELSLWHESGLSEWNGRLIAPGIDRVYLIDGMSAPVPISDSITPLYMSYVRAAFRPGGAKVFRNTLFLPIIHQDNTPELMLACRVNRAVKARLTYYPWTLLTGHAAKSVALDVALIANAPMLLSVIGGQAGRVAELTNLFAPSASNSHDADGTVPEFDVQTRDFPTGNGQPNHVRRLRLRYTLEADATGPPEIHAGFSTGSRAQTYEAVAKQGTYANIKAAYASYEALFRGPGWVSGLPVSADDPSRYWNVLDVFDLSAPGIDPAAWWITPTVRTRYIRARFRITDPVAKLVFHHVDLSIRPATHNR
jgi:hypothetical protein